MSKIRVGMFITIVAIIFYMEYMKFSDNLHLCESLGHGAFYCMVKALF